MNPDDLRRFFPSDGSSSRSSSRWTARQSTFAGQGLATLAAHSAVLPVLEQARARLFFVGLFFLLFYVVVIGRLFDVMIFNPDIERFGSMPTPPTLISRADITDRNGELLATSLQMASLSAEPALILDAKEAAQKLKTVFPDLDTKAFTRELTSGKRFVWVRRNLTPRQQDAVNRLGLPGLNFVQEEKRIYPKGKLTAHVIGYNSIDRIGIAGLEKSFDSTLRKKDGGITLALDIRLQSIVRDALAENMTRFNAVGAAGIIMDVHTGEILSLVSLPEFDPYEPGKADDKGLFNRATLGLYEMGSTFKIFTIGQALQTGLINLSTTFDCTHPLKIGRFAIRDYHPQNRWLNVPEIIIHSSNIGAAQIAMRIGAANQKNFMQALGLLNPSPVELPEVSKPLVPSEWKDIQTMTISYGHGLAVSAVQLASAVASIINGGHLVTPTLLKKEPGTVPPGPAIISPQTSDVMRQLLRAVVTNGTGKSADVQGYVVGGKTGTAEKQVGKGYDRNARLSSFISAFPMQDPRYIVFVMVDEPKGDKESHGFATGGWVAAPAVGKIINEIGPLLGINPVDKDDLSIEERLRLPVAVRGVKD